MCRDANRRTHAKRVQFRGMWAIVPQVDGIVGTPLNSMMRCGFQSLPPVEGKAGLVGGFGLLAQRLALFYEPLQI